jgi:hypothetical protein
MKSGFLPTTFLPAILLCNIPNKLICFLSKYLSKLLLFLYDLRIGAEAGRSALILLMAGNGPDNFFVSTGQHIDHYW